MKLSNYKEIFCNVINCDYYQGMSFILF